MVDGTTREHCYVDRDEPDTYGSDDGTGYSGGLAKLHDGRPCAKSSKCRTEHPNNVGGVIKKKWLWCYVEGNSNKWDYCGRKTVLDPHGGRRWNPAGDHVPDTRLSLFQTDWAKGGDPDPGSLQTGHKLFWDLDKDLTEVQHDHAHTRQDGKEGGGAHDPDHKRDQSAPWTWLHTHPK